MRPGIEIYVTEQGLKALGIIVEALCDSGALVVAAGEWRGRVRIGIILACHCCARCMWDRSGPSRQQAVIDFPHGSA
jgi:hypothetical protein